VNSKTVSFLVSFPAFFPPAAAARSVLVALAAEQSAFTAVHVAASSRVDPYQRSFCIDPGYLTRNPATQVECRGIEALVGSRCVDVHLTACRAASEAAVDPLLERSCGSSAISSHVPGNGLEPRRGMLRGGQSPADSRLSHGDERADFLKSDVRHSPNLAERYAKLYDLGIFHEQRRRARM
jgi:hypothetical protein